MPIVEGKYEAKISTTYASPQEGIDEIKRVIGKSRRIRISNIPMALLSEFLPLLKDKDLMIVLPQNEKPTEELIAMPLHSTFLYALKVCLGY